MAETNREATHPPAIGPDEIISRYPMNAETPGAALVLPVTPAPSAYIRNNFEVPADSPAFIVVRGLTGREHTVALAELRRFEARTLKVTLECAGNDRVTMIPLPPGEPWRGNAVATSEWTGASLANLLQSLRVADGASEFLFTGADSGVREGREISFQRSLPAVTALSEGPLLAYAMNGAEIPAAHGGPIRLVVPGWYAMASVKWLARIEAIREPFIGHFQTDRYQYKIPGSPNAPVREMRVKSIIVAPVAGCHLPPGPTVISGWAWSGNGPVTGVEVSVSADSEWRRAALSPIGSDGGWRCWSFKWTPETPGHYLLRSRASDASGNRQPDQADWNSLGYGNNSVRCVSVVVTGSQSLVE